jgi:hypothetical protein
MVYLIKLADRYEYSICEKPAVSAYLVLRAQSAARLGAARARLLGRAAEPRACATGIRVATQVK